MAGSISSVETGVLLAVGGIAAKIDFGGILMTGMHASDLIGIE
jgi:hypothetical protein